MPGPLHASHRAHAFADAVDGQWPDGSPPDGTGPSGGEPFDPDGARPHHGAALPVHRPPGLAEPNGRRPEGAADSRELLALVDRLRTLERPPELAPATRATQRAELVAALERSAGEGNAFIPRQRTVRRPHPHLSAVLPVTLMDRLGSRLSRRLTASGITLSLAIGAFDSAAAGSSGALPGDTLYGLKRGIEDLSMDVISHDTDRGRLHLDHASRRLAEARALIRRPPAGQPADDGTVTDVRHALTSMYNSTSQARRLLNGAAEQDRGTEEGGRRLAAFTTAHRSTWEELRPHLPAELAGVSADVTALLNTLENEQALRSDRPSTGWLTAAPASRPEHQLPGPEAADSATADGGLPVGPRTVPPEHGRVLPNLDEPSDEDANDEPGTQPAPPRGDGTLLRPEPLDSPVADPPPEDAPPPSQQSTDGTVSPEDAAKTARDNRGCTASDRDVPPLRASLLPHFAPSTEPNTRDGADQARDRSERH